MIHWLIDLIHIYGDISYVSIYLYELKFLKSNIKGYFIPLQDKIKNIKILRGKIKKLVNKIIKNKYWGQVVPGVTKSFYLLA